MRSDQSISKECDCEQEQSERQQDKTEIKPVREFSSVRHVAGRSGVRFLWRWLSPDLKRASTILAETIACGVLRAATDAGNNGKAIVGNEAG